MSTTTARILCGGCKTDPTGPAEYDNDTVFKCPTCGQTDRYEDIVQEAHNYMEDIAAKHLTDQMEDMAKGSPFMKVTTTPRPQRTYRWILDNVPLE